jgi:hypothetical protein
MRLAFDQTTPPKKNKKRKGQTSVAPAETGVIDNNVKWQRLRGATSTGFSGNATSVQAPNIPTRSLNRQQGLISSTQDPADSTLKTPKPPTVNIGGPSSLPATPCPPSGCPQVLAPPGGGGGGINVSDIRLKEAIVPLMRLDNGLELYRFRYKGGDRNAYVGVMAQDVQQVEPNAVLRHRDGYLMVNYDRIGLKLMTWNEWLARNGASSSLP